MVSDRFHQDFDFSAVLNFESSDQIRNSLRVILICILAVFPFALYGCAI